MNGLFRRLEAEVPGARAQGWIADREGVFHEARRGFGGQARTVDRLINDPTFRNAERIGWITAVKSRGDGAGALVIRKLLEQLDDAGADVVGLIVLPDDDAYVPRLLSYYRRFEFEPIADGADDYPIMARRGRASRDYRRSRHSAYGGGW